MSLEDDEKTKPVAGILALVAIGLTFGSAAACFSSLSLTAGLICALIAGFILEALSVSISAAGYFSLASPLYILGMSLWLSGKDSGGLPESVAMLGPLFLAVSLAGICGLGRLFSPSAPIGTRLAGYGITVLRTLIVSGVILGSLRANIGGPLVAVGAGYIAWLIFDQFAVNGIVNLSESEDTVKTWEKVLSEDRFLLAFPPALGVLGSGLVQQISSTQNGQGLGVLAVVATAMAGVLFRGNLRYTIDEVKVKDQEALEMKIKKSEHNATRANEDLEKLKEDKRLVDNELSSVYGMVLELGASTQLEETLGIVVNVVIKQKIPFQSCVILLYKKGQLTPVLSRSPYADVLAMSHLLQLEESLIKEVVDRRKPRLEPNVTTSSESRIFKDEKSVICVPLVVSKEIVGVIYVGSQKPNTHNEQHFDALKMLSAFAAPSMKTAMLFEDKEKEVNDERRIREAVEAKNAQLAGLQKMGQQMGASLKTQNTLAVVAKSLKSLISSAQSVILFVPNEDDVTGHAMKAEYTDTPYADYVRNLALRNDEGLLGKALQLESTILVQDTNMYDVQNLLGSENSVVVAPLVGSASEDDDNEDAPKSEVLGCLYVGAEQRNALTEEDRNLIETVSYQTAMALKNARLYEQTQQQALTDGLTGLYTHRLFQEKLSEELEWAERHDQHVVLVMVDADNFKTFNDTLGHPAGDQLLKEIASLLKDKVRSTDIVCRYGGDEFALLLKQTRKDDAQRMCERIREAFQLRFGGNEVQVTSSIGLACFPTDALTKKDLAKAADDALYVAKRNGRNMVAVSGTLEERKANPIEQEILLRPSQIEALKKKEAEEKKRKEQGK